MRQIGTLADRTAAQRFTSFLVTQGISAEADDEGGQWVIWVHEENDVDRARSALEQFRAEPQHERYRDADLAAQRIRQERQRQRQAAAKHVVQMRTQWNRPTTRRCPLVWVLIGLSVLVSLSTNFGTQIEPVQRYLNFCKVEDAGGGSYRYPVDGFTQVRQGQLWRTVTPIFLHFGLMHLIFNMLVLYYLGSQIEDRVGTVRFGLLVLTIAVLSNVGQYAVERSPLFGGMSGVGYGLFGYVWMKTLHDPGSGMYISPLNVMLMLGFFVLCVLREFPPLDEVLGSFLPRVANTAHGVGLALGAAWGYLPLWWRRRSKKP
ncbi:MAG: rhomboid family intramembrane serine protease [Pirellulaceae bacterium]|nr:rhomboid family intramembrane serine protease [Pirellulaceae bacterium]